MPVHAHLLMAMPTYLQMYKNCAVRETAGESAAVALS